MVFMNCCEGESKLQSLAGALTDCDRRRSYYLSMATCYCTPTAVQEFIDAIRNELNVVAIYLYLDRRTAISIGHADLSELVNTYSNGLLSVYAVKAGRLFHSKGYCVAAYSRNDQIVQGRLAIGSANLTNAGLTEQHGNIETMAIHSDIETIKEFLEFFDDEENLIALEDLTKFSPEDSTDFQYALLTSGLFSHKWSATLKTYFSVRFQLNKEGRQRAQEGIETPGFQLDAATIAKPYFDLNLQEWQLNERELVRNFGIECFLGHWIPKSVIESDEENNEGFNRFKTALFEKFDSTLESICQNIMEDYDSLLKRERIIDTVDGDLTQAFQRRIEALREDRVQLYRIWSGRISSSFPTISLTSIRYRRHLRTFCGRHVEGRKETEP